jgi:hypothetical protein
VADIGIPQLNKSVLELLAMSGGLKIEKSRKGTRIVLDADVQSTLKKDEDEKPSLLKSFQKALNHGDVERLAFEADPSAVNRYQSIYKPKQRLIPDRLLKRIAIQDDLVAAIVQARQNQMAAFARPRPDRFSTGFVIEARQDALEEIEKIQDPQQKRTAKDDLQKRIAKVTKLIMTCGRDNLDLSGNQDDLTFPQYISMSVRNAIVLGRIATEILWDRSGPQPRFVGFRVIDAGTIYKAEPHSSATESVRRDAEVLLAQMKNERISKERFERDEYKWIQVIEDRPVQAFADDECIVHNFYPVPDYELDGYPVTPLDTVISAVTTHINITVHNKLYFQSGRAARGMLIFKSDDIDQDVVARVRQQFNAQINSVNNAWRMPVFGVGTDEDVTWQPIDSGGRDMEFQYLADMNARVILSAFQMSPEELPGWSYLSRGTNSQALSESNNEYKMEAARDVGIRPLLAQFEDFINQSILPLFDPDLAKKAVLKFVGLDAETAEKESVRLQQDMPVHMTYDEVLEKVEKKAIGKEMGGEFPLNPQFQAILDKYKTVGEILEFFFDIKGAAKDPQWAYVRDPFWFQWQQMMMQQQQMQQQQQQMQVQAQQQAQATQQGAVMPNDDSGGGDGGSRGGEESSSGGFDTGSQAPPVKTEKQKSADVQDASAAGDLSRSADQAIGALSKAEAQLPPSKRKLLHQQKMLVEDFLKGWEHDQEEVLRDILDVADKLKPNTKA